MKKTLAILLTMALVLCMVPGTAFATELAAGETVASVAVADIAAATYTGAAITPDPVVTAVINVPAATEGAQPTTKSVTLVKDTDYTVTYENNTNAGTATAKIAFIGAFAGQTEVTKNFTINKLDLTSTAIVIAAGSNPITSVSNAAENVKVTLNGNEISTGFTKTAAISPNDAGTVLVTVTAAADGNFTGTKTAAFYLKTAFDSTYKVAASNVTYTGSAVTPALSFTKGNAYISLTPGTDYTVAYANNVNAGPATITVTGAGKYTGTITGTFNILPKAMSGVTVTVPNVPQNGSVTPVVKDGTKTLVYGTDYTYVIPDTSVIGTKYLTVTGINNYTGTLTASYTVIDANKVFTSSNVTFGTASPYYNGNQQQKEVTVKVGNTTLTKDYDYKVEYTITRDKVTTTTSYAQDAGTYTVTVTGIGAYSGSATSTFTINQVPIAYVTASASAGYTTSEPYVTVKDLAGTLTFVKDKDYTVYSYTSTYTKKCYVTVTSTGKGNLSAGTIDTEFAINGKNISYCSIGFATGSQQYNKYTGSGIRPVVKITDGYTTLTEGTDYTVSYKDATGAIVAVPRNAGTYSIEITGKGAYSGTATLSYFIEGVDISSYTVTLKEASVKADGTAKTPVISSVKQSIYTVLSSTDYTVSYMDSTGKTVYAYEIKNPGTYKAIVTGKGGYTGSTSATFTITGTPQKISVAKTEYKVYKDSESFTIKATATGDGTGFSYVSSNPSVASVSAAGKVTIHKIGRAKITVTTTGMKNSDPASEEIIVKVYPDKAKMTQKPWTEGKKGSLRVRWEKQADVTYYEVRYSRDKSFKKGSYLTKKVNAATNSYDTQSTSITNLKSGSKYYVKVRAVKVVYNDLGQEVKYYGTWSGWKSCTTK